MCGHSNAACSLNELFNSIPIKITSQTPKDKFSFAVSALQTDIKFRASIQNKEEDISAWWAAVISCEKYSVISPVIKACLSIFTGPRVEGSFSVMNNIINPSANKMLTKTYEAIHKLKYKFLNSDKNSCQMYKREDPVFDPIDKSLCFYMQTAYSRQRKATMTESKSKLPRLKKITIHKKASQVRDAIDHNTKSQSSVNPISFTPQQQTKTSDNAHQNTLENNSTSSFTKTSIKHKEAGCSVTKNISHVSDKSKMIQQPLKVIQQPLNMMFKRPSISASSQPPKRPCHDVQHYNVNSHQAMKRKI